jgi:hypothetical protein
VPELSWKRHERQVARLLGGRRQPNTGRRAPDVVAGPWCVEVKTRRTLPRWLLAAVVQAEGAAQATGKLPLVVLVHAPGKGRKARRYALLPLEVLSNLAESEVIRDEGDAANR